MTTQRPPQDIDARRFFEEWLPAAFVAAFGPGGRRPPQGEIVVRVQLDGDGGGTWDLSLKEGKLAVSAGAVSATPQVTLTQTVTDWRAVTVGEEGAITLTPQSASPLDMLFIDSRSRDVVATVRGTIRFEVTDFNGRTWSLLTKLGDAAARPGAAPDATITVDADTYGKILSRQMQPPEAYFAGKIRLSGDTGLAMQLAMAMLPRFTS